MIEDSLIAYLVEWPRRTHTLLKAQLQQRVGAVQRDLTLLAGQSMVTQISVEYVILSSSEESPVLEAQILRSRVEISQSNPVLADKESSLQEDRTG